MTNRSKAKGDRAELEVQTILRDLTGHPARRALGAGRQDDIGDIHGLPSTVISVANYADLNRAIREKLPDVQRQMDVAGVTYGAMFARRIGGSYVVVMTPEQWATYWRETL